jgi:POT family proton-dependent oligopeptide transporter
VFGSPNVAGVATDAPPPALNTLADDNTFFGQPRGLATLFQMEMWERFSYYGIRPLLVLFMTAALASGGFGFDRQTASSIVGIYAASAYLAALPGGWVADRWLGLQKSIYYGGILISIGHLFIALSVIFPPPFFFIGLVFIVLGTGLLKPNVSAIVGDLYPEGGSRRDAGFSIFYMGINTGALIAPLVTGYLGERVGWHWGFGAAGIGMLIGVIMFRWRAGTTLRGIGIQPATKDPREQRLVKISCAVAVAVIAIIVGLAMIGAMPLNPVSLAENMGYVLAAISVIYFAYVFIGGGLNSDEMKRVAVIIVLFVFAIIFWAAFEQAPTSLNLFARDYTDRVVFGWEMPTLWLQAANSVFVIGFAPVFAWIWLKLGERGRDLSSSGKFAFGLFTAGLGFLIMVSAANIVIRSGGTARVSPWWLVASYLLQTFGELSLSPVGLSSMTKLAPRKFAGQMMGVWFLATSIGNLIAGLVGGKVDPEKLLEMPELFKDTALALIVSAVICALLAIPIRKMMHEVPTEG